MVRPVVRTPEGLMDLGAPGVISDRTIEAPPAALSKLGGPGATDVVIGSVDIPATRLTTDLQLLSSRIGSPPGWDSSQDVLMTLAVATNATDTPTDGQTLTVDFSYIYARSGIAALSDLGKTVTTLTPVLTFATAEGLAPPSLYALTFALDRNDVDNPYEGETTGGFGFQFNINAASVVTSIDIIGALLTYPALL